MPKVPRIDPKLLSLAESVEQTGLGPKIYLQTAAAITMGTPVASSKFDEVTYSDMYIRATPSYRTFSEEEATKTATAQMGYFEQREDDGMTCLTLIDVVQDSHVGYSLTIPVMRVPLQHVLGWWAVRHETKQPKGSGGGLLVGGGFSF